MQETAAGALHSLAERFENRTLIADADGISLLIPLFEGASAEAKAEVGRDGGRWGEGWGELFSLSPSYIDVDIHTHRHT